MAAAITPNEWRFRQVLEVSQSGLTRVSLPAGTLDAARPSLEDLRMIDPDGREVPYIIDRPLPQPESALRPKDFRASIEGPNTRLNIVTGTHSTLRAVSLEIAGQTEFIKPARVEGSHDGRNWQLLADHEPIFRMAGGATKLRVSLPDGAWEFLRLTIGDTRSPPIPFTGAELHNGALAAPSEPMTVAIKSRDENPGVTRLALNLGAMNLTPAIIHIETTDPLFARTVAVAVPQMNGDDLAEQTLASAIIYRMDTGGGKTESRTDVVIDQQVNARELLLLIANGDSPPLAITGIRAERRTVNLVFSVPRPGRYLLLAGNSQCPVPNYDLTTLAQDLKALKSVAVVPSAMTDNPEYKAADSLAAVSFTGAKIDVRPWAFRKSVKVGPPDTQQIDVDLDILARAAHDLRDLRLVCDDRQIPFLVEKTSISRAIPLGFTPADDPKKPNVSRWSVKLAKAGWPIARIICSANPGVFQRDFRLSETVSDGPGEDERRILSAVTWTQTPNQKVRDVVFELNPAPVTDTLMVETDNGDNPPIQLSNFRAYYPVSRVVFKSSVGTGAPTWLYYGNPDVSAPHYDMTLVARELLRSERSAASTGPEENLKARATVNGDTLTGPSRYIFWGVLALVVVGLLLVVARFVPKAE